MPCIANNILNITYELEKLYRLDAQYSLKVLEGADT